MYEHTEIIEETEDRRLVLAHDPDHEAPCNEGMAPLVRIDYRYEYRLSQEEDVTSYRLPDGLVADLEHIFNSYPGWRTQGHRVGTPSREYVLERYLSLAHGVTKVETLASQTWQSGGTWLAFDPADWRESMGITDEQTADPDYDLGTSEWQAFLDGDVWGWRLEERVEWTPVNRDSYDVMETWEEVNSCWGYFGYKWAAEAAREDSGWEDAA